MYPESIEEKELVYCENGDDHKFEFIKVLEHTSLEIKIEISSTLNANSLNECMIDFIFSYYKLLGHSETLIY